MKYNNFLFLGNWQSPIDITAFKSNGDEIQNEDLLKVIDNNALTFFEDTVDSSSEDWIGSVILKMKTVLEVKHVKIINKVTEDPTVSELSDG